MKTILVTGVAGFIGGYMAEALLDEGCFVVGVDNFLLGRPENIKNFKEEKNFAFYNIDINKGIDILFGKFEIDSVFHFAANSDISKGDSYNDYYNTFLTTYTLLEECRKHSVKEFLFASSGAVYGAQKKKVKESTGNMHPISYYGAAKLSSEAFISAYSHMCDIKSFVFRLPNVIGAGMTHGVILDFIKKLKENPKQLHVLGNGKQKKPYMNVYGCISAMLYVLDNANEMFNCYNLSQIGRTSVKKIAKMVVKEFSPQAKITYGGENCGWVGDIPTYKCDISKLKKLDWFPIITSNSNVELTIEELHENIR